MPIFLRMSRSMKTANPGMFRMGSSGLVGIYFFVGMDILIEAGPLSLGEKTEISIDHKGSHHDFWESLTPNSAAEKKFKSRAYDAFPRGRVLFHLKRNKFIIYRDRCLSDDQIRTVMSNFGLRAEDCDFEYDAHYKCAVCNPNFMD